MKTINWGVIGCGEVTEVKSGPAFQKVQNSNLRAVMRRNSALAADYARRHRVPKWYDDADKLIHDPDVDSVYIATPPDSHREYTLRVAAAGKPVYVEKPMARNYQECLEMIEACKQAKVPLFTAYYRRSLSSFIKIKEFIDRRQIGEVRFINVSLLQPPYSKDYDSAHLPWRVIPEIAGGGYFIDLASHTLDLLDYFFGPVTEVNSLVTNQAKLYPAEDTVVANLRFKSGVLASAVWCFCASSREDKVTITGSEGEIFFSTFIERDVVMENKEGRTSWPFIKPEHIQQPHVQSIVNQLNGTGICPSDGLSAARTNWVMDQILAAWRKNNGISF
jgi:predicted dehydrogenase